MSETTRNQEATSTPCCDGNEKCYAPLEGTIDTLSRKYAMQLVCVVGAHDTLRFGEIENHFPSASTSTLSSRLDELEDSELMTRSQ
ncbi:MAG: winged helix-turn-helix transcriptional regulator, partial [Halobacteria archaeon]|nr:winged helix-turn-helix transcriptional regulator [Halobacteria archaeon]